MNESTKDDLWIVGVAVLIIGTIVGFVMLAVTVSNTTEWTPIDNRCYVRYHEDNKLFGEDSHSRVVYCKE